MPYPDEPDKLEVAYMVGMLLSMPLLLLCSLGLIVLMLMDIFA